MMTPDQLVRIVRVLLENVQEDKPEAKPTVQHPLNNSRCHHCGWRITDQFPGSLITVPSKWSNSPNERPVGTNVYHNSCLKRMSEAYGRIAAGEE
jgi:hypothetical protein